METNFFDFLRQQSTATSGSSFTFNYNIFKCGNEVFICFLSIVLFWVFYCKWKLLLKLGESQFFKDKPYSCQWTPIFSIFQRFFKVEAAFPYSGNVFFNIFHPASANGFSAKWKHYFLVSAISLLVETMIGIRRKQFWEKELILASGQLIFWLVEIIFFLHFSETLVGDSLFFV